MSISLEAVRQRHTESKLNRMFSLSPENLRACALFAHQDRGELIAEVERLQAEIAALKALGCKVL